MWSVAAAERLAELKLAAVRTTVRTAAAAETRYYPVVVEELCQRIIAETNLVAEQRSWVVRQSSAAEAGLDDRRNMLVAAYVAQSSVGIQ